MMTADIEKLKELAERVERDDFFTPFETSEALEAMGPFIARIEELEKERDEALDRCDQLELEADTISAEFEKELWANLRPVIEECGCDWRDHLYGMSAEDAVTYIRESLDSLEDGQKRAIARAEAAEKRVAELEAALQKARNTLGGLGYAKIAQDICDDALGDQP